MQDKINELIAKIKSINSDVDTDRPTWTRRVSRSNGLPECREFVSANRDSSVGEIKKFLDTFDDEDLICIEQDDEWIGRFYISAYQEVPFSDEEYIIHLQAGLGILEPAEPLTCSEIRLPTGKVLQLTEAEMAALKLQLS